MSEVAMEPHTSADPSDMFEDCNSFKRWLRITVLPFGITQTDPSEDGLQ